MQNKRFIIVISVLIFVAGLAKAGLECRRSYLAQRAQLAAGALHNATAFSSHALALPADAPPGAPTRESIDLRRALVAARDSHPSIGFASLLRFFPATGRVVCLGAAGPEAGAERIPSPGEPRDGTADAAAAHELAFNNTSAVVSPFHCDWENRRWVSGYARCDGGGARAAAQAHAQTAAAAAAQAAAHVDIFRCDIRASYWFAAMAEDVLVHLLAAWMLPGLPFAAFLLGARHRRRELQILQLGEAIEQADTAIMIIRATDDSIKYANPCLCKLVGYAKADLSGRHWRVLRHLEPPDDEVARRAALIREGIPIEAEWEFRRKDGSVFPVRATITPVRDKTEKVADIIFVIADITEHHRQAGLLKREKEKAEHDDHANALFIAAANNEVAGPLEAIDTLSARLASMTPGAEQSKYAAIIRTSITTLKDLTRDLADFSRIESGRISMKPEPVNPRHLIQEVLDLVRAQAAAGGIALLNEVAGDVPARIVIAADRLRQVLLNLAGNAIKFTEAGEIEIRLKTLALDELDVPAAVVEAVIEKNKSEGRLMLLFSVRDTGIGISKEHLKDIFVPFRQIDSGTRRRYGGVGLGLSISRQLVHLLGGEIAVKSEPGRGATFYFTVSCTLPREQTTQEAAP